MEWILSLSNCLLLLSAIFFFAILVFKLSSSSTHLPPGPHPWPFVGNLPLLLRPNSLPHRTFAHLARNKYGSIFLVYLGSMPTLVVNSVSAAKEILQTHDIVFADRPDNFGMVHYLLYGPGNLLSLARHGPDWQAKRKLWTVELLSQKQLQKSQYVRHEEIAAMVQNIRDELAINGSFELDLFKCVSTVVGNVMSRLALSQKMFDAVARGNELFHVIEDTIALMLTPLVGDFVPVLSFLDVPTKRRMVLGHKRLDKLFCDIIAERKRPGYQKSNDVLDLLLSSSEKLDEASLGSIKTAILEMFVAGMDTTSNTMAWAMAELLRHPSEMRKLQEEIDTVVGRERSVLEPDLDQLHYLKAVVKEVFRLHPVAPMMIPHCSKEKCEVGGFVLPAKTRVLVNIWAIGRDPSVWKDPEEFKPARFVGSTIDVKGQHFELTPFGSGRRMCPGNALGLKVVYLTLANLVHSFDWSLPNGKGPDSVDMTEFTNGASSLTLTVPLVAVPKLRLLDQNI